MEEITHLYFYVEVFYLSINYLYKTYISKSISGILIHIKSFHNAMYVLFKN